MGVPVCLVPGKKNNVTHDPLWEIPILDLIRYFRNVEAAYSSDSPREILTRIRVHYYDGLAFSNLLPEAPTVVTGPLAGGIAAKPRRLRKLLFGEGVDAETYDHLTSHADEHRDGTFENPSPYFVLNNCEEIDLGHVLLGIEALRDPVTVMPPYTTYGIPRVDPASWVADVAIASVWTQHHLLNGQPHGGAPRHAQQVPDRLPGESDAARATRLGDAYYKMSAPIEDLVGDVDFFGIDSHWDDRKPLSRVFAEYYLGGGVDLRWDRFRQHALNAWAFTSSASAIKDRVDRMADLVGHGAAMALANTLVSPVRTPPREVWPQSQEFIDRFYAWVAKKDGLAPP